MFDLGVSWTFPCRKCELPSHIMQVPHDQSGRRMSISSAASLEVSSRLGALQDGPMNHCYANKRHCWRCAFPRSPLPGNAVRWLYSGIKLLISSLTRWKCTHAKTGTSKSSKNGVVWKYGTIWHPKIGWFSEFTWLIWRYPISTHKWPQNAQVAPKGCSAAPVLRPWRSLACAAMSRNGLGFKNSRAVYRFKAIYPLVN